MSSNPLPSSSSSSSFLFRTEIPLTVTIPGARTQSEFTEKVKSDLNARTKFRRRAWTMQICLAVAKIANRFSKSASDARKIYNATVKGTAVEMPLRLPWTDWEYAKNNLENRKCFVDHEGRLIYVDGKKGPKEVLPVEHYYSTFANVYYSHFGENTPALDANNVEQRVTKVAGIMSKTYYFLREAFLEFILAEETPAMTQPPPAPTEQQQQQQQPTAAKRTNRTSEPALQQEPKSVLQSAVTQPLLTQGSDLVVRDRNGPILMTRSIPSTVGTGVGMQGLFAGAPPNANIAVTINNHNHNHNHHGNINNDNRTQKFGETANNHSILRELREIGKDTNQRVRKANQYLESMSSARKQQAAPTKVTGLGKVRSRDPSSSPVDEGNGYFDRNCPN